jgi:hypothetical protein
VINPNFKENDTEAKAITIDINYTNGTHKTEYTISTLHDVLRDYALTTECKSIEISDTNTNETLAKIEY